MTLSPRVTKLLLAVAVAGILCLIGVYEAYLVGLVHLPSKIARVAHSDQELQDAIRKARKMLAAFKYRLEHPQPGDLFAIKAQFQSDQGPEYIWMKDPTVSKDGFAAIIDQQPIAAKVKMGQLVDVPEQDVVDWLIQQSDGTRTGAFTDAVLSSSAY